MRSNNFPWDIHQHFYKVNRFIIRRDQYDRIGVPIKGSYFRGIFTIQSMAIGYQMTVFISKKSTPYPANLMIRIIDDNRHNGGSNYS